MDVKQLVDVFGLPGLLGGAMMVFLWRHMKSEHAKPPDDPTLRIMDRIEIKIDSIGAALRDFVMEMRK